MKGERVVNVKKLLWLTLAFLLVSVGTVTSVLGAEPLSIPEPTNMLLLGSGLIGLAVVGRKKLFK